MAMNPSMDASAECVRKEVIKSRVRFEGVNWLEATRYIASNRSTFEARQMGVQNVIPDRRYTKGRTPGVRGEDMKSKHDTTEIKWVFKKKEFTSREPQLKLGAVTKIGVKTLFKNHVYEYGNYIYKQVKGGPTGLQVTGRVSKIRMIRILRRLKKILKAAGVEWAFMFIYMTIIRWD